MTLDVVRELAGHRSPPADLPPLLLALWHDARGNWDEAHRVAQDVPGTDGAWVHAYLHRKEGDQGNAGYWYRHAGRPDARGSLDQEWEEIAATLLTGDLPASASGAST